MSRPLDMPAADRFTHGTRARYVTGCRCDACRESNRLAYHERERRRRELAAALPAAAPGSACPGINGVPCPRQVKLYRNSGGACESCQKRLVFNGLVDAAPAREHLAKLSRRQVGYKTVADAARVGVTTVAKICSGERTRIRAEVSRRILEVDIGARADHSTVPAGRTWKLIAKLIQRGWTRRDLARALGSEAITPALQLRGERILARSAAAVEKFFRRAADPPERGTRWHPRFCDCIRPTEAVNRCRGCGGLLRPEGMTKAAIAGGPETTKPVHRAFGFEGGWGFDQRSSKKAKVREERELRQLVRAGRHAASA